MQNLDNLRYSAVLMTGATSGIGHTLILTLFNLTQNVCFCNLSRRVLDELTINQGKVNGHEVTSLSCDLSDAKQIEKALDSFHNLLKNKEKFPGRILVINNSGYGVYGEFTESNGGFDEQIHMLDVNAKAPAQITLGVLDLLKERGGDIVNISSLAAFQPMPYFAMYAASKAFVSSWSLALGEELKRYDIRVLTVCPGPTATQFHLRAGFKERPLKRDFGLSVEVVSDFIISALAKRRSGLIVPGFLFKCISVIAQLLPMSWSTRVAGWSMRRLRLQKISKGR
jgi:short-subunit dehydrogenase